MLGMLHFHVNPTTGVPVYRQIMDQVKYYIASGTLTGGEQVPSIRDMSRHLAVNPTTIVKAYSELEHEGVIERRHGKGVFVAESRRPMPRAEQEAALRRQARQLAVEAGQMGASEELVLRIVDEELKQVNGPTMGLIEEDGNG
jgi:GntR family transcriptional regulator